MALPLIYGSRDRFLGEPLMDAEIAVSPADQEVLRPLAAQVAELAARPEEEVKRELWRRHNDLEPTRPLIFCDLENGWTEVVPPDSIQCRGDLARWWELFLRKELFWGRELADDAVIRPCLDVPYVHGDVSWRPLMEKVGGLDGGAYTWKSPIKTADDLDMLRPPEIVVDRDATDRLLAVAQETFRDLLSVRLNTRWFPLLGISSTMASYRGLEQIMLDMIDDPDLIHRMMGLLTDGYAAALDSLEGQGLLSLNNDGTYVGQGGFGWTAQLPQQDFDGTVRLCDTWGNAESQETVGISPDMFAEFVFPYQVRLLERFGLNCYGCCEPLDTRWHIVKNIPRLRRVSVSPWSDLEAMADNLGDRYVFSMKPNPTDLAMPHFDEDRIRAELRTALRTTRDCRVEVIMKDNHTLANDPARAVRWVRIARQEAERL